MSAGRGGPTVRERAVLRLGMARATVHHHLKGVYGRLGVRCRAHATGHALRLGIVTAAELVAAAEAASAAYGQKGGGGTVFDLKQAVMVTCALVMSWPGVEVAQGANNPRLLFVSPEPSRPNWHLSRFTLWYRPQKRTFCAVHPLRLRILQGCA